MLAIERGLPLLTQAILQHPQVDVSQVDRRERNILHYAVIGRNLEVIHILREKHLLIRLSNQPDMQGVYPMSIAARRGYLDITKALLEAGVNPSDPVQQTVLKEAILGGHLQVVKLLLDNGADVSAHSPRHFCPLSTCLMSDHEKPDILQVLLEAGADVNASGISQNGYSPLQFAVDQGYLRIASMIVLANCNLAADKDWIKQYNQRETNDDQLISFLQWVQGFLDEADAPVRLTYWCRRVIRAAVNYKTPISGQIDLLPLPPKLKNFLLFRDCV